MRLADSGKHFVFLAFQKRCTEYIYGGKPMFENRRRQKRRNSVLVIVGIILLAAFSFGYYLNNGGEENIGKNTIYNNDPSDYRIPDSIKNPGGAGAVVLPQVVDAAEPGEDSTNANANADNLITPSTKVIYKTYFTLCSHMQDREPDNYNELVNLTEEQLQSKYPDWKVKEFSKQQVILTREIQTYCPRHYIIGILNDNIAIYVYNSEGKKVLYEETETPISTLTPADQKKLEYGIVVNTADEVQQMLEGFSE
jgi:hypothetical protein